MPGLFQAVVNGFGELPVFRRVGAVIIVKANMKLRKIGAMFPVSPGNQFFRRDAFILGAQHDGGAVGIIGANINGLMALHLLKAHPYIRLNVFHQVAEMNGAIGVR